MSDLRKRLGNAYQKIIQYGVTDGGKFHYEMLGLIAWKISDRYELHICGNGWEIIIPYGIGEYLYHITTGSIKDIEHDLTLLELRYG